MVASDFPVLGSIDVNLREEEDDLGCVWPE
jgi:hypothetical protein